jgi:hypothetical protein
MHRLIQFMAFLALLLAPASMLGSHAAMAMPHDAAAITMDHCADKQAPSEQDRQSMIDCAIACAAMPAAEPLLVADETVVPPALLTGPAPVFDGSAPEIVTPPPRLS